MTKPHHQEKSWTVSYFIIPCFPKYSDWRYIDISTHRTSSNYENQKQSVNGRHRPSSLRRNVKTDKLPFPKL